MSRSYHRARSVVGTVLLAVFLVLPLVRVNGESALRFDVPTLRLLFFGTVVWMEDFFIILVAVLALTFLTLFITTAFGRIWCGWLCPQTVLVDLTPSLDSTVKRGFARRSASYLLACATSMFIAASMVGYFVSPYEALSVIRAGGTAGAVVTISWSLLSLLLFLDLVALRRTFCRTVCPYAKLQGVLFDDRTLIVAFDRSRADECMRCAACVHACPVGIDIRKGTQAACIHCAECVDACRSRMAVCSKPSLVDYSFGEPGARRRGLRVSLYLTGGLTVASVLLLLYLSVSRIPFEASVSPVSSGTEAAANDGSVTNLYVLTLRNTGAFDLDALYAMNILHGMATVRPDTIRLVRGQESVKTPITVTVSRIPDDSRGHLPLVLVIKNGTLNKELKKPFSFLLPVR